MEITKQRWYHNGLSHWRSGLAGVERLTVALLLSCVLERDAKVEAPQDEVGGARQHQSRHKEVPTAWLRM